MSKEKKPLSKRFKIVVISILTVCALIFIGIMALPDAELAPETTTASTPTTAAPSEKEFLKKLGEKLDGAIGENETITDVSLERNELIIRVDLSKSDPAPLTLEDLALARAGSITDAVLDFPESLDLWETVTVDFGKIGKVTENKSAAKENEFGMLCFPEEFSLQTAD